MDKSDKKPESFIPHQQKAINLLTDIRRIKNKYVLLAKPKMEKEISDLLEENKDDYEALSLLVELVKNPETNKLDKIEEVELFEPMLEKLFKKFVNPQNNESTLFLSENGDLYRKPKEGHCYKMEGGAIRHDIVKILAGLEKGKLIYSRELMKKSDCGSYKSLTDTIGKINASAEKSIKLSKRYKLIISRPPNGYMINDFYTIFPE